MTPRDTFNTFVSPAAADCQSDPGATHRAVSALCHIDALAEEVWHATKRPEGSVPRYRNSLQEKCVELGYAWDVHEYPQARLAHPHVNATQQRAPAGCADRASI